MKEGSPVHPHSEQTVNPPNSLCLAARLHHGEGLRPAPVPEVELVVGGDQEELSGRVEGQRGDGNITLCEPTLTAALQKEHRLPSVTWLVYILYSQLKPSSYT